MIFLIQLTRNNPEATRIVINADHIKLIEADSPDGSKIHFITEVPGEAEKVKESPVEIARKALKTRRYLIGGMSPIKDDPSP